MKFFLGPRELRWFGDTPKMHLGNSSLNVWTSHQLIGISFWNRERIFWAHLVSEIVKVPLKKREIFGCFERHLSFWVSDVESPLIFYTKKKEKIKYKLHDWIFPFHWLSKKEYIFEKLKITWLWVLVINYQIITWLFVLVTIYQK